MERLIAVLLILFAVLLTVFTVIGCSGQPIENSLTDRSEAGKPDQDKPVILATTTSTRDTGLLDVLLPAFKEKYGITVKPIAVGTGEALKMGERGDADVLLVHARQSEDEFMAKGFGEVRKDVMYNDFVLIGPKDDPAGVRDATSAVKAFKKIAFHGAIQSSQVSKSPFISRGDDSGTYKKELEIWEKTGAMPDGRWYLSTGQGMAATIRIANEKLGYTLTDRGTYLVQKDNIDLAKVLEKSDDLLNPYGVIAVSPDRHPRVNYDGAMKFIEFLTSDEGQKIIGEFGKKEYGQALFTPDAK